MPPLTRSRPRSRSGPARARARRRRPLLLALIPPIALVVALVATPLIVRLTHEGEALPGTTVAGVDVGGLDAAALRARLRSLAEPRRAVVVLAGGRRLTVEPTGAGYRVDLGATAREALDAGRGGALGGLPATLAGLVSTRHVEPVAAVDPELLRQAAERLGRQVGKPSFPGGLKISGDLDVTADPPRAGREIDGEQLRTQLRAALLARSSGPLRIAVRAAPIPLASAVETIANETSDYPTQPFTVTGAARRRRSRRASWRTCWRSSRSTAVAACGSASTRRRSTGSSRESPRRATAPRATPAWRGPRARSSSTARGTSPGDRAACA